MNLPPWVVCTLLAMVAFLAGVIYALCRVMYLFRASINAKQEDR